MTKRLLLLMTLVLGLSIRVPAQLVSIFTDYGSLTEQEIREEVEAKYARALECQNTVQPLLEVQIRKYEMQEDSTINISGYYLLDNYLTRIRSQFIGRIGVINGDLGAIIIVWEAGVINNKGKYHSLMPCMRAVD